MNVSATVLALFFFFLTRAAIQSGTICINPTCFRHGLLDEDRWRRLVQLLPLLGRLGDPGGVEPGQPARGHLLVIRGFLVGLFLLFRNSFLFGF